MNSENSEADLNVAAGAVRKETGKFLQLKVTRMCHFLHKFAARFDYRLDLTVILKDLRHDPLQCLSL